MAPGSRFTKALEATRPLVVRRTSASALLHCLAAAAAAAALDCVNSSPARRKMGEGLRCVSVPCHCHAPDPSCHPPTLQAATDCGGAAEELKQQAIEAVGGLAALEAVRGRLGPAAGAAPDRERVLRAALVGPFCGGAAGGGELVAALAAWLCREVQGAQGAAWARSPAAVTHRWAPPTRLPRAAAALSPALNPPNAAPARAQEGQAVVREALWGQADGEPPGRPLVFDWALALSWPSLWLVRCAPPAPQA
jgi:hypothetical protein